jgi:hypothetical protein
LFRQLKGLSESRKKIGGFFLKKDAWNSFYKIKLTRPKLKKNVQILMNLFHTFDKKNLENWRNMH